jgi:hypothetical protein
MFSRTFLCKHRTLEGKTFVLMSIPHIVNLDFFGFVGGMADIPVITKLFYAGGGCVIHVAGCCT